MMVFILMLMLIRVYGTGNLTSHSRPENGIILLHFPDFLLLLNQFIHWIVIVHVDVNLFVEKLIISFSLFWGEAFFPKAFCTHEDPHVQEVILLLLYVFFTLHNGIVQELTLVPLVTVESRDTCTYLFDLHAVWELASTDIDFVVTN